MRTSGPRGLFPFGTSFVDREHGSTALHVVGNPHAEASIWPERGEPFRYRSVVAKNTSVLS